MGFFVVYGGMGTLAFVLGLALLVTALKEYRLIKRVQQTSKSLLRNVDNEFVEITAEVMKSATMLTAPLSGEECVWYSLTITQVRYSGKNTDMTELLKYSTPFSFTIEDESEACVIDFDSELFEYHLSKEDGLTVHSILDDTAKTILDQFEIETFKGGGNVGRVVIAEKRLSPGDELYMIGIAYKTTDENGSKIVAERDFDNPKQLFFVTDQSEDVLIKRLSKSMIGGFIFGCLTTLTGLGAYAMLWYSLTSM